VISYAQVPTTTAAAPSTTGSNMSVYKNSTYGIKIQFPSDWVYRQSNRANIVTFIPLSTLNTVLSNIGNTNISPFVTVGLEILPYYNLPLNFYNNIIVNKLTNTPGFHVVESNPTILAGNAAHRLVYTHGLLKTMTIYTVEGNKAYIVAYSAGASQYSPYLATALNMINSLSINRTACTVNNNFC
jgi:hypothetical protein